MDTTKNPTKNDKTVQNPVRVYCRLSPLKTAAKISSAEVKDLSTVQFPSHARALQLKRNYVFKQVFDEDATQADVYNSVARPLVERLIRGCNSLLFMYGVTGSGKTYTMTGAGNQCGILPRCLKTLFQTIESYQAPFGTFQTDHLNGFEIAIDCEANLLANREPLKSARSVVLRRKNSELDFNVESLGPISKVSGINEHNIYAVYVSYVEIYNNSVYDLLEECTSKKVLQSHIVREDANHNMYIHGAVELQINSVQEAIDVFQIGQKRKRMGQTALNAESSRSHSIFNIRLVQAPSKKYADIEENLITISQLSLVDLAGIERSSRTKNTGVRLRETGKINNSLMKLRECLEYLRENQQNSNSSLTKKIPYRDSKLTYLFKNFFEGDGEVSMVVCINPNIQDNAENAQVLKFGELIQDVQIVNTKPIATSTPLKHQAWNKENIEQAYTINNEKKKPILSVRNMSSIDLKQHDLNQKKIMQLEKQNLELRLELTRIREAYRQAMGHSWCSTDNFLSSRKPLCENTSITQYPKLEKPSPNIKVHTGQQQSVFLNELNQELSKRRKKLEENLIENKTENLKKRQLCRALEESIKVKENQMDSEIIDTNKDISRQNITVGACNLDDFKPKRQAFLENTSLNTPKYKKMKFDECIQSNVFASLKLMTPKMSKIPDYHSTPYNHANSSAKRKLHFFNEKDPDFDKREIELSLKLEKHRKKQIGNQYLMNILSNLRRSKSSISLFHMPSARKNLFPEHRYCTDEE